MICDNCGAKAAHIFSDETGEHCENCSNISVVSKNKTDGLLTRNSWRLRRQQSRHEGDIVRPHVYDKNLRREKVNPDFLKLYPNQVKQFFSSEELKRDGYKEMPKHIEKNKAKSQKQVEQYKKDTVYSGSSKKAIAKFLNREKEL